MRRRVHSPVPLQRVQKECSCLPVGGSTDPLIGFVTPGGSRLTFLVVFAVVGRCSWLPGRNFCHPDPFLGVCVLVAVLLGQRLEEAVGLLMGQC